MKRTAWMRTGAVAAVCALVGAGAGIAGSAAAPTKSKSKTTKKSTRRSNGNPPAPPGGGRFGGRGGRPVHAEEVVLNKAGDAFITVTEDSGKVKSVSGNDVTITEGTGTVTYKDVTVTIPDGATVYRNGAKAAVSDLAAGDQIHVESSSDATNVFAADAAHADAGPGERGHGPGGPHGGPGDHDGPPIP